MVPPDPLWVAAAAPIGPAVPPFGPGAGWDGAPNAGAVVVVVEASAGHGFDPAPAHCADGVVVVVLVDFRVFFGFGHVVVGAVEVDGVVELEAVVVVVVDDPDLPFDFLAVVVAAVAAGAEAAARCRSVWGTPELPATAGV